MYSLAISMCYELRDAKNDKEVTKDALLGMMDNFLAYIMANFETELVIMASKLAIKTYGIEISTKLKSFDEFHKRFSKFVLGTVK